MAPRHHRAAWPAESGLVHARRKIQRRGDEIRRRLSPRHLPPHLPGHGFHQQGHPGPELLSAHAFQCVPGAEGDVHRPSGGDARDLHPRADGHGAARAGRENQDRPPRPPRRLGGDGPQGLADFPDRGSARQNHRRAGALLEPAAHHLPRAEKSRDDDGRRENRRDAAAGHARRAARARRRCDHLGRALHGAGGTRRLRARALAGEGRVAGLHLVRAGGAGGRDPRAPRGDSAARERHRRERQVD